MGSVREESDYTSRVYSGPFLFPTYFLILLITLIYIGDLYPICHLSISHAVIVLLEPLVIS
jgi:hypothetical protein